MNKHESSREREMAGLVVDGVCVEEGIREEIKKKKKGHKKAL